MTTDVVREISSKFVRCCTKWNRGIQMTEIRRKCGRRPNLLRRRVIDSDCKIICGNGEINSKGVYYG